MWVNADLYAIVEKILGGGGKDLQVIELTLSILMSYSWLLKGVEWIFLA